MTANKVAKRREWRFRHKSKAKCAYKLRYLNILDAIKHCQSLSRTNTGPVSFYHCENCEFIHVGHLGKNEGMVMYGPYSDNLRELQA